MPALANDSDDEDCGCCARAVKPHPRTPVCGQQREPVGLELHNRIGAGNGCVPVQRRSHAAGQRIAHCGRSRRVHRMRHCVTYTHATLTISRGHTYHVTQLCNCTLQISHVRIGLSFFGFGNHNTVFCYWLGPRPDADIEFHFMTGGRP